jgi:hypothetical protein
MPAIVCLERIKNICKVGAEAKVFCLRLIISLYTGRVNQK